MCIVVLLFVIDLKHVGRVGFGAFVVIGCVVVVFVVLCELE